MYQGAGILHFNNTEDRQEEKADPLHKIKPFNYSPHIVPVGKWMVVNKKKKKEREGISATNEYGLAGSDGLPLRPLSHQMWKKMAILSTSTGTSLHCYCLWQQMGNAEMKKAGRGSLEQKIADWRNQPAQCEMVS